MSKEICSWILALAFVAATGSYCEAQLTDPRGLASSDSQVATLEEQLINRLRATTEDRRAYIRMIGTLIANGTFEQRYVFAIERYAIRKNPHFPFPYFERAMRFEAEKRGIELPTGAIIGGLRIDVLAACRLSLSSFENGLGPFSNIVGVLSELASSFVCEIASSFVCELGEHADNELPQLKMTTPFGSELFSRKA